MGATVLTLVANGINGALRLSWPIMFEISVSPMQTCI